VLRRFGDASKAVQKAYNLGLGRPRVFGDAVPSLFTRLVLSRAPFARPLLPELLQAAQGNGGVKVRGINNSPTPNTTFHARRIHPQL
jgi:hypothetical protein